MARIIEKTEASGVGADDYVLLCSPTLGERKFKAIDLVPSEATLIEKTITTNGTYNAEDDEADGYSEVSVNVQPSLASKTVTANGTYKASAFNTDGFGNFTVNVPDTMINTTTMRVTENGSYSGGPSIYYTVPLPEQMEEKTDISVDILKGQFTTNYMQISYTHNTSGVTSTFKMNPAYVADWEEPQSVKARTMVVNDDADHYIFIAKALGNNKDTICLNFSGYTINYIRFYTNASLFESFEVDVPIGENIDGLYFDGTTNNNLRPPFYAEDYEIEVNFYTPSYQANRIIFGNTANGYYPICFMVDNIFRVNNGAGSQIDYTPSSFQGDHTLILNRLNDRAIIFDEDNIGTYGTSYFSTTIALDIGKADSINLSAAEFVLKQFKITDHTTGEVLADYKAGFRYLNNGYKIPCLLNTIDGTYIDLITGRSTGNNDGHIMLCQQTNDNYVWYYNQDKTLVVRQKLSDNSFRWYFNNYDMQGFDTVPANLQRFILNGVGARAGIGDEPGVVGFYDDTIRGWTPTLGYNITGITKGIIESTDTDIDYDNAHEWENPTFDPING